jgi:sugar phosphate isomerase/epimerase
MSKRSSNAAVPTSAAAGRAGSSKAHHADIRIGSLVALGNHTAGYIRRAADLGFESFSLTAWKRIPDIDLAAVAADVRAATEDTGTVISTVAVFGNPLEHDEEAERARKDFRRLIDSASAFGCDMVTGFTGALRGRPIDESRDRLREVFEPLVDIAGQKDLRIAFENCKMGGSWASGGSNIPFNQDGMALLFDTLPQDNVGLEWEPAHLLVQFADPMLNLHEWGHKVFHVHGKDATVRWSYIKRYGISGKEKASFHRHPGFGDSNWSDIITELRLLGYRGSIDIEGFHDPIYRDELEMTGQLRALRYLKECRGGKFVENLPDLRNH